MSRKSHLQLIDFSDQPDFLGDSLILEEPLPDENNPAQVYIDRNDPGSQPALRSALRGLALLLVGKRDYRHVRWEGLTYQHATRVRAQMLAKLSPKTVNRNLAVLRGVIREAWAMGLVDVEQRERIRSVRNVRHTSVDTGRLVGDNELRELFQAIPNTHFGTSPFFDYKRRAYALLALVAGCGLRRTEVVSLRLDGYDAAEATVVVQGKGNKQRYAHMPPKVAEFVADWVRSLPFRPKPPHMEPNWMFTSWMFPSAHRLGEHIHPEVFAVLLDRVQAAAGLTGINPHDLRRTYATRLLRDGVDTFAVMRLMGHASPETTKVYDKRPEDELHKAVQERDLPL